MVGRGRLGGLVASCAGVLLLWLAAGASAATIAVNTEADEVAADSHCSLREAISAANGDSTGPGGDCAKGNGTDTVRVPRGHFTLSIAGSPGIPENANATGDLDVLSNLNINGAGAGATKLDANGIDRVLEIRPGRVATIRRVTVTGGRAPDGFDGFPDTGTGGAPDGGDAQADPGDPGAPGGGIFNNAGSLTVLNSTITGNTAGTGGDGGIGHGGDGATASAGGNGGEGHGGAGGAGGDGGGIDTTGVLVLTRVRVTQNKAGDGGAGGSGTGGQGGGAISGTGGTGGLGLGGAGGAGGRGGGVAESGGGSVEIQQSVISGNTAGVGAPGGPGQGGAGGVSGGSSGHGGAGGTAQGGIGGAGGRGGGVSAVDPAVLTRDLIALNRTGAAGHGGNGTGGLGGATTGGAGSISGDGGTGFSGQAGFASMGGGAWLVGSVTNSTVRGNVALGGGDAGNATGGNGGASINGTGGDGGAGSAHFIGNGGDGGSGGGLATEVGDLTILHDTVTANRLGAAGAPGTGTPGSGGNAPTPGSPGTSSPGDPGSPGKGGADYKLSGDVRLTNSIVAGNDAPSCYGTLSGGHNIAFPASNCPGAKVNPKLGALADNGGPTKTQALKPGSPAIDAVPRSGANCSATDQRAVARPNGPRCDIGAYEFAPPTVATGAANAITTTAATLHGRVNPNARGTTYHFVYGKTTAYGNSTPPRRLAQGTSSVAVSARLGGLTPGTTYHYRLVATNADGTKSGRHRTFTTG
jgi:CSLREA domain-containing protein